MAPSAQAHRRSHSLLLFQKLLNLRDSASPLTLVLDTLEQSGRPVVDEFITRAKISHAKIIFISFATIKKPAHAHVFVKARGKSLQRLRAEIVSHYCSATTTPTGPGSATAPQKILLLIDTLNPVATTNPRHLTAFLTSLLTHHPPTATTKTPVAISLIATYHADVPLPLLPPAGGSLLGEYEPHPLAMLHHLATAVLRVASLAHSAARRRARDRSLPEPDFGLGEGREGVLVGVNQQQRRGGPPGGGGAGAGGGNGLVVDMELRRRSGRAVVETFVLVPSPSSAAAAAATGALSLLSDHPLFAAPEDGDGGRGGGGDDEELAETTFNLGLTEKQRKDRDGIVLPYFDAQQDIGGGEGGRILYEMGREDDFDDEEDEI